jgi:hypothetical protein
MEEEKNESPLKKLERNTSQEKGSPSELKKL